MGIASANMQWSHFVGPSCSQKRESTAFELIIQIAYKDFRVPVSKLVEIVLHVRKGTQFGVEKVNDGQNICSRDAGVGNEKHFVKQAQSSKSQLESIEFHRSKIMFTIYFYTIANPVCYEWIMRVCNDIN